DDLRNDQYGPLHLIEDHINLGTDEIEVPSPGSALQAEDADLERFDEVEVSLALWDLSEVVGDRLAWDVQVMNPDPVLQQLHGGFAHLSSPRSEQGGEQRYV